MSFDGKAKLYVEGDKEDPSAAPLPPRASLPQPIASGMSHAEGNKRWDPIARADDESAEGGEMRENIWRDHTGRALHVAKEAYDTLLQCAMFARCTQ